MAVAEGRRPAVLLPLFLVVLCAGGCIEKQAGKGGRESDARQVRSAPAREEIFSSGKPALPEGARLDIGWGAKVAADDTGFSADERLARACVSGNRIAAEKAVAEGANPSGMDAYGRTPLMYAAKFGRQGMAAYLCSLGVPVDERRPEKYWGWPQNAHPLLGIAGGTALMEAAMHGDTGIARLLLKSGASLKEPSGVRLNAAIFLAAHEGHADMVDLLMETAGDTIPRDWRDQSALDYAVRQNHTEVVERFLGGKYRIDGAVIASALCAAADSGNLRLAGKLLGTGLLRDTVYGKAGDPPFTPLIHASRLGRLEMVRMLVERGARIDRDLGEGLTPLSAAAGGGHAEVVRYLLGKGAGTDFRPWDRLNPLSEAIKGGHGEIARLFLRGKSARDWIRFRMPKYEFWEWPPGSMDAVLPFLADSMGMDPGTDSTLKVSMRSRLNQSYLSLAAVENAVVFIRAGMKPDFDRLGITRLAIHAVAGDIEAMKGIIGADDPRNMFREIVLNEEKGGRMTALDWAIRAGKAESVKFLVESGAEINPAPDAPSDEQRSRFLQPLELAFARRDEDIIRYLIGKGARMPADTLTGLPHFATMAMERPNFWASNTVGMLPLSVALALGRHYGLLREIAATGEPSFTPANLQVVFLTASMRGDLDLAEYLLEGRPELADQLFHVPALEGESMGRWAFVMAAAFDRVAILDLILRKARPPADWTPILADALDHAERCGRKAATAFILKRRFGVAE